MMGILQTISLQLLFRVYAQLMSEAEVCVDERGTLVGILVKKDSIARRYQQIYRRTFKIEQVLLVRLARADRDTKELDRLYALDAAQRHGDV